MKRRLAEIPVKKIDTSETLREVDQDWVRALAGMMAQDGQVQPIEVAVKGDGYALVFGLHRLLAADILRWKTIAALVDEEAGDAAARRRRAIHENLFRRELSFLDRSVHIGELHALHRTEVGERRGGDRRSARSGVQKSDDRILGLLEKVADKVGLSRSTVADAVFVERRIGPDVRQRIVRSETLGWIADSRADLMALAKGPPRHDGQPDLSPADLNFWQLTILAKLERGEADDVAGAIGGLKPTSETERLWTLAQNMMARLQGDNRDRFFAAYEQDFLDWQRRRKRRRR